MLASTPAGTHVLRMLTRPVTAACALLLLLHLPTTPAEAAQLGQTEAEVREEHGTPQSVLDKGNKRTLIYREGRIKLEQGVVVEITGILAPADPTSQTAAPANLPVNPLPEQAVEATPVPAYLQPVLNQLVNARHLPIDNPGLEHQRFVLLYFAEHRSTATAALTAQLRHSYSHYRRGNNFEVLFVSRAPSSRKWPATRPSKVCPGRRFVTTR